MPAGWASISRTLSKIENSKAGYLPGAKTIRAIAAALDADALELLELAKKVPPELEPLAGSVQARRFLERVQEIASPDDWAAPNDFDSSYPPKLIQALCDFMYRECSKLGLVPASSTVTTANPNIGALLRVAWLIFRSNPSKFAGYERAEIQKLRADLGVS